MIGNSEEFYQALGIPYRIVNIVSGTSAMHNESTEVHNFSAVFTLFPVLP